MNRIELPVNLLSTCIIKYLEIVFAEFQSYFNDVPLHVSWHRDPFNIEIDPVTKGTEELAEFKVSDAMKLAFNN